MKARSVRRWAALVLLVSVSGAWAQSGDAATGQTNGINPALLARAQAGDASAQYQVGWAYEIGDGVLKDFTQSSIWFRKAAEQGSVDAQALLCAHYVDGSGVPKDSVQAAIWCRKAAEQGDAFAQFDLGSAYETGDGVPQDHALAASWYHKAADQGYTDAQFNLGRLYYLGTGVRKDYGEAYFYFSLASAGRSYENAEARRAKAQQSRDLAATKLTKRQLSQQQDRAAEWFSAHPPHTASADTANNVPQVSQTITARSLTENQPSQASNSTVSADWKEAEINQIRAMVQAIKHCPASVNGSAASTIVDGPPYNVTWDVSASQSVRAPYAGYIELTVPTVVHCSPARRQSSPMGCDIVERPEFPLVLRYEYDLSPDGLSLSKILVRRDNETEWSNRPNVSNYCWEGAAQQTGEAR
jgi:TPR repeat protein